MVRSKHANPVQAKTKTSQQQGEFRAHIRLEHLKNKFINLLMRNGERSKASKLFESSLNRLQSIIKNDYQGDANPGALPRSDITFKVNKENDYNEIVSFFYQAVENVKPTLELRRVRKGGTTYQVPAIVSQKRQERLAIKWLIESALKRKKKNNQSFSNCLVKEILEAFHKTGQPRQRRDEQLKIAEYNRAYTRYRWW